MASRAKKKKVWREQHKTNGDMLAELFSKGIKCADITNALYGGD